MLLSDNNWRRQVEDLFDKLILRLGCTRRGQWSWSKALGFGLRITIVSKMMTKMKNRRPKYPEKADRSMALVEDFDQVLMSFYRF